MTLGKDLMEKVPQKIDLSRNILYLINSILMDFAIMIEIAKGLCQKVNYNRIQIT
jgi:hypothetical protein